MGRGIKRRPVIHLKKKPTVRINPDIEITYEQVEQIKRKKNDLIVSAFLFRLRSNSPRCLNLLLRLEQNLWTIFEILKRTINFTM